MFSFLKENKCMMDLVPLKPTIKRILESSPKGVEERLDNVSSNSEMMTEFSQLVHYV